MGKAIIHEKGRIIAISRWGIAYIVDQDQNVGFNRPLRSGFHWNDLWIRNREPVKDQQANLTLTQS